MKDKTKLPKWVPEVGYAIDMQKQRAFRNGIEISFKGEMEKVAGKDWRKRLSKQGLECRSPRNLIHE